jgi:hypothetical protein
MADARDLHGRALQRILSTPHMARAVPRLPADLLHRVIRHHGLEDSAELVALATPEQLNRVFDLDLWRSTQPGLDEQFDARRFGTWLQVLLEGRGAAGAAQLIAELPIEGMVVGLSQHVRVFDVASLTYETLDGNQVNLRADGEAVACEVGGYRLEARRDDAWDAIVEVLLALDENHRDRFELIVRGCRALSNSRPEESGMHDLLDDPEQVMFNLAADRERRRERAGYATPAQARAFLEAARRLRVNTGTVPPVHPVAQAYFRALAGTPGGADDSLHQAGEAVAHPPQDARADDEGVAAVIEVLRESGVLDSSSDHTRALPAGEPDEPARLSRIRAALQYVSDRESLAFARQGELGYLANVMMAGCSIQDRPFEPADASDAVLAVCNLGLAHWPGAAHVDVLVAHDVVQLFQVGWAVLHQRVALPAARLLIDALITVRGRDRHVQIGVTRLRAELQRHVEVGTPWRARSSLEVIASLDLPAWAALRGLFDECPVMTSVLAGSRDAHRINPVAFEFISEREQLARVEQFLETLPQVLSPT